MMLPEICKTNKSNNLLELHLFIKEDLFWFQGHFKNFPILPAVALLYLVKHFTQEFFAIDVDIAKINRVKFLKPIKPNSKVILSISLDTEKNTLKFTYSDLDKQNYSLGTLKLCQNKMN